MNRYIPFGVILTACIVAIVLIQRGHISTQPGPQALLTAAADAQHEATRVPMRFDRMTDAEEITLGNDLAQRATASLGAYSRDNPSQAHTQDERIQTYLQLVGTKAAAHARRSCRGPSITFRILAL